MKKVLSLVLAATLVASLSACGGALVDLDTPKSDELTAQYDFYPDAMNTIRADMKITPEQADEVFIVLTSCGLDGKITSISESKGAYTVYYGGSSLDVTLSDGAVETVYSGRDKRKRWRACPRSRTAKAVFPLGGLRIPRAVSRLS